MKVYSSPRTTQSCRADDLMCCIAVSNNSLLGQDHSFSAFYCGQVLISAGNAASITITRAGCCYGKEGSNLAGLKTFSGCGWLDVHRRAINALPCAALHGIATHQLTSSFKVQKIRGECGRESGRWKDTGRSTPGYSGPNLR